MIIVEDLPTVKTWAIFVCLVFLLQLASVALEIAEESDRHEGREAEEKKRGEEGG